MDLFNTYASQVRSIAVDADAGRISQVERDSRLAAAYNDYFSATNQAYAQTKAENDARMNFLAGAVGAFATGYAQGQAAQGSQAPVTTTCTKNGNVVNCTSF